MKKKAITLIELLIAMTVFGVVAVAIYSAFSSGVISHRNIDEALEIYQGARLVLERLNLDLRNCFSYQAELSKFSGSGQEASFYTLVEKYREGKVTQDYCLVSYKAQGRQLLRLCRRNREAVDEDSQIQPQELVSSASINFQYGYTSGGSAELQFKDTWGETDEEKKTLPLAVKANLALSGRSKEEFERTIILPLADAQ
jgi:prepilin-type N-terminal cleavage/methylation domain-containing protein